MNANITYNATLQNECKNTRVDRGSGLSGGNGKGIAGQFTITKGRFAGRQAGGGTNNKLSGLTSAYGSGYPQNYTDAVRANMSGPVNGLGLPYLFWPVEYSKAGFPDYYGSSEYVDDEARPGGPMTQYTLNTTLGYATSSNEQTKLALWTDAVTAEQILTQLHFATRSTPYFSLAPNFTINPKQAIGYWRGSSIALLLDGYDNGIPLMNASDNARTVYHNATLNPLPTGVNTKLVDFIGSMLDRSAPLVSSCGEANGSMSTSLDVPMLPTFLLALFLCFLFR